MRIALHQPDIAGNVGTILRLAVCLGVAVDIIEPCGFAFSDRALRRSAMDYAADAVVERHADWAAFDAARTGRLVLLSTHGDLTLAEARFHPDDIILLGSEGSGVPRHVHDRAALRIRIPMRPGFRSLNVAVSAGIALGEALRQTGDGRMTLQLDADQSAARAWFESLRDRICATFEAIEAEAGSDARFAYTPWNREGDPEGKGGGGVQGLMKGRIFEKVGVNVSTVGGAFAADFAKTVHGAGEENPAFFATGISLVAHMANPHVPAVHMNTRFLTTTKRWFGGGADLNPPIPHAEDSNAFHARLKAACDAHDPAHYPRFSKWADDYFWIPHRHVHRGVGGIFYDHLECGDQAGFAANLAFTRDVGEAFLDIFPRIVRARMGTTATDEDRRRMLAYRGRYAEFNLVYDRGTAFGLKTGGNIDAILMSLPPVATWE